MDRIEIGQDRLGAAGDDFYAALMAAHEGLSFEESARLNAKLVLLLANQGGRPGGDPRGAQGRAGGLRKRRHPSTPLLCALLLSRIHLDDAAAYLVFLDAFEQGAEIAFAEAFVALALDELEEDRSDDGL